MSIGFGAIGGIGGIGSGLTGAGAGASALRPGLENEGAASGAGGSGGAFGRMLQDLTDASRAADLGVQDLAVGGGSDLHDVTLSMELESLSFDLAVQIRNKLVDAYQEIFRMQV